MSLETAIRLALTNNERAIKADQNMLVSGSLLAQAGRSSCPR